MPSSNLEQLITRFVSDLEAVFRDQALASIRETLATALGGAVPKRGRGRPRKTDSKLPGVKKISMPSRASTNKPAKGSGRIRRTVAEIERDAHHILEYVKKNPGRRSEDIRAALKIDKAAWTNTMSRLIEKGQLKSHGEKRNTTYTAA